MPRTTWAFTGPWDPRSEASARRHLDDLDVIISGWIALDSVSGRPTLLYEDSLRLAGGTARYAALVTSWHGERFHPETIRRIGRDPRLTALVASEVAAFADAADYWALVLDFEALAPQDLPQLLAVARAIADSARARGTPHITIAIPAADTAGYPALPLLQAADQVLVMLYDQHWRGSRPGPVAAPDWARESLALRVAEVGARRVIAGFPFYGYLWPADGQGETVGYDDARRAALDAGVPLEREPASQTLRASRRGEWELWVTDAVLLDTLIADAERLGVRDFAFWHLGLEDERVWTVIGKE